MEIEITAMERDEKEILLNLLEKYEYELSQYFVHYVNEFGLYGFENLAGLDDFYYKNAKGWVFFIKVDGKLAGFAIVLNDYFYLKSRKADYVLADLFVMYRYRGMGVGKFAANYLFDKFKGIWQLNAFTKNANSVRFWVKVISEYTGKAYEILPNEEPVEEHEIGEEHGHVVFHFSTDK